VALGADRHSLLLLAKPKMALGNARLRAAGRITPTGLVPGSLAAHLAIGEAEELSGLHLRKTPLVNLPDDVENVDLPRAHRH
jgi:hypothetical protein